MKLSPRALVAVVLLLTGLLLWTSGLLDDAMRIVLRQGGCVSGRVETPVPLPGWEGLAVAAFWEPQAADEAYFATTELADDGTFTLSGLPLERTLRIAAGTDEALLAHGLYSTVVDGVRTGATDVVIPLHVGKAIEGWVVVPEGALKDETFLTVSAVDTEGQEVRDVYADIDDEGAPFGLLALPPGCYTVRVEVNQHVLVDVAGVAAGTRDLQVTLPNLTRVSGRVLGLPKGGTARVVGRFAGAEDEADYDWVELTDGDGFFVTHDVPEGKEWIVAAEVRAKGLIGVVESVRAGQEDVEITLREGLAIEGRARRDGDGERPPIQLRAVGHGHLAWGKVEDDWTFRLGPLLPGTFRIIALDYLKVSTVAEGVEAGTTGLEIVLP